MARVYLANDVGLDRLAALKIISGDIDSPDFRQRFAKEAQLVARFRHPHIVAVYSSGESAGRPYIAFEYEPGGSLAEHLEARGRLPEHEALDITGKMASALAYAHRRHVIHRDVKPANILFDGEGEPILSDFGIAKPLDTEAHLTRTGLAIGSPRYMSPEQLRGERVGERTDVYSLGLVLVEMLTGDVPGDLSPQALARAGVPGHLLELVQGCLRADPRERLSAQQCAGSIEQSLARLGRPRRPGIRRTWLAAGVTVAVVLAAAVFVAVPPLDVTDTVRVTVEPETARLFLDGVETRARELSRENGVRRLAAVAPGYFGAAWNLPDDGGSVSLGLAEWTLPDAAEFAAFHAAFEGVGGASARPASVDYPPYRKLLDIRFGDGSADRVGDIVHLAELGDAAARVEAFLLASESLADLGDYPTEQWLQAASQDGFALATYYLALHHRWREEVDGALAPAALREFRRLLALAKDQGLTLAAAELEAVDQLLQSAGLAP